jgi:hypothetical protein
MLHLRHMTRSRWLSRLLAMSVAYALAIQAMMASVGAGMSAFAASGQAGFAICGQVSAPGPAGDRQRQSPAPPCPFCFVAAQSAGHIALASGGPAVPAYAALPIAALADHFANEAIVLRFPRTAGDPRAPPVFSV